MKMTLVAIALFACSLPSASFARADVSHKWEGPYLGADFGIAYNTYNFDDQDEFNSYDRTVYQRTSVMPAIAAGYDWRFGSVVTGLQLEYDADLGSGIYHEPRGGAAATTYGGNLTSAIALTGRAGILAGDQGLFYLRFGGINAKSYQEFDYTPTPTDWRWNGWVWGMLVGPGAEFALNEHLSLVGEYLHGFFVPKTVTQYYPGGTSPGTYTYAFSPALDVIRIGVNYRF